MIYWLRRISHQILRAALEIVSEGTLELLGEIVSKDDLLLRVAHARSPFAEGPAGFCLALMEKSVPDVFIEARSAKAGKLPGVRPEETLKCLLGIDL